jgi:hypothetical protein
MGCFSSQKRDGKNRAEVTTGRCKCPADKKGSRHSIEEGGSKTVRALMWVGELAGHCIVQDCKQGMEADVKEIKGRSEWMMGGHTRLILRLKARCGRG